MEVRKGDTRGAVGDVGGTETRGRRFGVGGTGRGETRGGDGGGGGPPVVPPGVTAIRPEELEFPNTMTDIDYDTWMLRWHSWPPLSL